MNTIHRTSLMAAALMLAAPAFAGERTVTLAVENVSCVTCAPIVKRTLSRVPGVSQVVVADQAGTATATVSF
jgi:mercuric ion binding protein